VTQTPAGWYPDPAPEAAASPGLRYWDGTAWTAHTAPGVAGAKPAGPTTPDGERLAGWWMRVAAYVIDSVFVAIVAGIASLPAQIQMQQDLQPVMDRLSRQIEQNPDEPPDFGAYFGDYLDVMQAHAFWLLGPSVILTALYWAVFLRWRGATPGKMILGLRVRLRERAGGLPWSSIVPRMAVQFGVYWTFYVLAVATASGALFGLMIAVILIMLLDPLWATWDSKRQTLHDKLARTNVVTTR
jgi:uncharacterized RDD family membrane protein YckC